MNARLGFPADRQGAGQRRPAAAQRGDVREWLQRHGEFPALGESAAPGPRPAAGRYDESTWDVIAALLSVLPRAAAHLATVFAERGAVDFPQGSLAALDALGDPDAPSDLLLRMDLRLEHLLIDEFQDTSFAQLDLLARLTAGWSGGDGRTLFAVGDPMQSIYRFRGAEVRVFVDAQQRGMIAGVPVEQLTLRRNFRAQARLVDWVNAVFPAVLGAVNDPWRGAVAFAPAVAEHPARPGPAMTFDACASIDAEAECVVAHVRAALAGDGDVAILARSRGHLAAILPALRAEGIAYAAVDLDRLGDRPAVLDLQALTHALVQPADRLAWLAVLRAPWCGLVLADLCALVAAADAHPSRSLAALVAAAGANGRMARTAWRRTIRRRHGRRAGALAAVGGRRGPVDPRRGDPGAGDVRPRARSAGRARSRRLARTGRSGDRRRIARSRRGGALLRAAGRARARRRRARLGRLRRGARRAQGGRRGRRGNPAARDDDAQGQGPRIRHRHRGRGRPRRAARRDRAAALARATARADPRRGRAPAAATTTRWGRT